MFFEERHAKIACDVAGFVRRLLFCRRSTFGVSEGAYVSLSHSSGNYGTQNGDICAINR